MRSNLNDQDSVPELTKSNVGQTIRNIKYLKHE